MHKIIYFLFIGRALAACPEDYSIFYNKHQQMKIDEALEYRETVVPKFINTRKMGSANLEDPFIASHLPDADELFDQAGKSIGFVSQGVYFHTFRNPPKAKFPALTLFSKKITGPDEIFTFRESKRVLKETAASLERLYNQFALQGPERQILVDIVKKQDETESNRTVHFLAGFLQQPVGHAQILISRSKKEPLHIETQWKSLAPIPGKKRGELGRLSFFQDNETLAGTTVDGVSPEESQAMKKMARLELIHRMLSWANHDAALDSLSFQVNPQIAQFLEKIGLPLGLAKKEIVSQVINEKKIEEYIFILNKNIMKNAEDILLKKIMSAQLEAFLENPAAEKIALSFTRNQMRSLFETKIFGKKTEDLISTLSKEAKPLNGRREIFHLNDNGISSDWHDPKSLQETALIELWLSRKAAEKLVTQFKH